MMAELHLIDWASIGINKLSTYDISLAGYPRHNATSLFPAHAAHGGVWFGPLQACMALARYGLSFQDD